MPRSPERTRARFLAILCIVRDFTVLPCAKLEEWCVPTLLHTCVRIDCWYEIVHCDAVLNHSQFPDQQFSLTVWSTRALRTYAVFARVETADIGLLPELQLLHCRAAQASTEPDRNKFFGKVGEHGVRPRVESSSPIKFAAF